MVSSIISQFNLLLVTKIKKKKKIKFSIKVDRHLSDAQTEHAKQVVLC